MKRYHQSRVDKEGNFRNMSRKDEGYLMRIDDDHPFPALVTAWYPKSQTMDVARPVQNGLVEYQGVLVYGNFFDTIGTLHSPQIATERKEQDFITIKDPNSSKDDPTSDDYVLDNHIEALIFKISIGNTFGFAASTFRYLNTDSPLLNNTKSGRKIICHDDGSYYIHDADGNIQFRHPSGLKLRAGKTLSDIDLEVQFPTHAKNSQDYGGEIVCKLEHPSGSYSEYTATGSINHNSAEDINLDAVGSINLTAPNINANASTKYKVDSPESEMTGNLTVGGIIKAVGDIIADWTGTAISLLNHFHLGNLGYNTGTPLASGGTSPPSSPPSYNSGSNTVNLNGMDLEGVGGMSSSVSTHTHHYYWNDTAGEDDTDIPN